MSIIDLYSNQPTLRLMLDLTRIALEAHSNNPSPVDIKLKLSALDAERLMVVQDDLMEALKPFKVIAQDDSTHDDYWDCNCEHNYIHAKTEERCPKCNAYHADQPNSMTREVEAFLKGK